MFKKIRIKLFRRSKKEIYDDMQITLDEISEDLADIKNDLDDLHETVNESLRLTLIVQEQCEQIIEKMEKKDERTLEEIVDNIEKLVGKDNAKE